MGSSSRYDKAVIYELINLVSWGVAVGMTRQSHELINLVSWAVAVGMTKQ